MPMLQCGHLISAFPPPLRDWSGHALSWVPFPTAANIGLQLLLPRPDPRRVMLLGDFDAAVTEQHRDPLHWYARLEQTDCERIPEAVRVTIGNVGKLEHGL